MPATMWALTSVFTRVSFGGFFSFSLQSAAVLVGPPLLIGTNRQ